MKALETRLTRRDAITGALSSHLVAFTPVLATPALDGIPALFAEWERAYVPYLAALKEYSRVEGIFFADHDNPAKAEARDRAEAAKDAIEDGVIDLEGRIIEAPATSLADVLCKLRIEANMIGLGDGKLEDATCRRDETVLRVLADLERIVRGPP